MTITFEEAQQQLAQLLDKLIRGEEVVITRNGQPFARLVPDQASVNGGPNGANKPDRVLGAASGQVRTSDDFDSPLEEFREYME